MLSLLWGIDWIVTIIHCTSPYPGNSPDGYYEKNTKGGVLELKAHTVAEGLWYAG
jgi:hypothetical protein